MTRTVLIVLSKVFPAELVVLVHESGGTVVTGAAIALIPASELCGLSLGLVLPALRYLAREDVLDPTWRPEKSSAPCEYDESHA